MNYYLDLIKGNEAREYLNQTARWLLASVDQNIGWPTEETLIIFQGITIALLPHDDNTYPCVAVKYNTPDQLTSIKETLLHFFSSLSWWYNDRINLILWEDFSGNVLSKQKQEHKGIFAQPKSTHFRPCYLPNCNNETALALAFYREGLYLNHEGYAFLSFFKIINLKFPDGKKRGIWVNAQLDILSNMQNPPYRLRIAQERLAQIKNDGEDPGIYLFKSCRCAVAHAGEGITYYPEKIEDITRFSGEKPLIMYLAKRVIETEFSIYSKDTFIEKHPYELGGFCEVFGEMITEKLKSVGAILASEINMPDRISISLWGKPDKKGLQNLIAKIINIQNGIIELQLSDDNNIIEVKISLDFPSEKLTLDYSQIRFFDKNTSASASLIADIHEFMKEYLSNGVLEIKDSRKNIILSRLLEYIPPFNIIPLLKNLTEEGQKWRTLERNRNIQEEQEKETELS